MSAALAMPTSSITTRHSVAYYECNQCLMFHYEGDRLYGWHLMFRRGKEHVLEYGETTYA
jgi:hypothetical protein